MILELLVFFIFVTALYKLSPVAFIYASLIYLHDQYFGYLYHTDYQAFTMLAGVFTAVGLFVCYYFRQGVNDTISYYLYNISILTLLVNIITFLMGATALDMESLIPVFVAINVSSVLAIIYGDSGGSRLPRVRYFSNRHSGKRNRRRTGMVRGEKEA